MTLEERYRQSWALLPDAVQRRFNRTYGRQAIFKTFRCAMPSGTVEGVRAARRISAGLTLAHFQCLARMGLMQYQGRGSSRLESQRWECTAP